MHPDGQTGRREPRGDAEIAGERTGRREPRGDAEIAEEGVGWEQRGGAEIAGEDEYRKHQYYRQVKMLTHHDSALSASPRCNIRLPDLAGNQNGAFRRMFQLITPVDAIVTRPFPLWGWRTTPCRQSAPSGVFESGKRENRNGCHSKPSFADDRHIPSPLPVFQFS